MPVPSCRVTHSYRNHSIIITPSFAHSHSAHAYKKSKKQRWSRVLICRPSASSTTSRSTNASKNLVNMRSSLFSTSYLSTSFSLSGSYRYSLLRA